MTDPFQFIKKAYIEDNPSLAASDEAVESWTKLAGLVQAELTRLGLPASIITRDSPIGPNPPGALIFIDDRQPFGVTVRWNAAATSSPAYREKLVAQDHSDPLLRYMRTASDMINHTIYAILKEAGFHTLVDNDEHNSYIYRVLSAPRYPLN